MNISMSKGLYSEYTCHILAKHLKRIRKKSNTAFVLMGYKDISQWSNNFIEGMVINSNLTRNIYFEGGNLLNLSIDLTALLNLGS